jgi:hypothetical protein
MGERKRGREKRERERKERERESARAKHRHTDAPTRRHKHNTQTCTQDNKTYTQWPLHYETCVNNEHTLQHLRETESSAFSRCHKFISSICV